MQIPSDMYQLYVVTGVLNSWFATLLAVMNLFAFTLVAACAATGAVRINWSRIFRFSIISLGIFAAVLLGTRFVLSEMVSKEDFQRRTLMQSRIEDSKTADIKSSGSEDVAAQKNRLGLISKRGKLRLGYNAENLPFSFVNDKGDLVGFDVELMHMLAREL
jgi:ABC-type amino acid transport substrate-binding protein